MAKTQNPGCNCCCNGTVRARVSGCGVNLGGVTVTIQQGATTLGSGATDSGGYYPALASPALAMSAAGSYTASTPAVGRLGAGSQTSTLACAVNTLNVTVPPLAAYVCCGSCGAWPVARTLTLSDIVGSITLTYAGTTPGGANAPYWTGCALRSCPGQILNAGSCYNATVNTPVLFKLCSGPCSGSGSAPWELQFTYPVCFDGNLSVPHGATNDTCANFAAGGSSSSLIMTPAYVSGACNPLALTFRMVNPDSWTSQLYPSNSTFSVVE